MRNVSLSTDHCFSMFQHATHTRTIVVLDTAWPWASEAYGLCFLRAYFCAHKLIRARSYVVIPEDSYRVLAAGKNELAARAFQRASALALVLWSWALAL